MESKILLKEGAKWILITFSIMLLLWAILPWKWYWLIVKLIATAIFIFTVAFFRNPERAIPDDDNAILAPADGKIIKIWTVKDAPLLKQEMICVSTFMSIFDVHINRSPVSGVVENVEYKRGEFLVASKAQASERNEQNALLIHADNDKRIVVVQIAGILARRIICRVDKGDRMIRGLPFGMIVLGSRVDLYLPKDVKLAVKIGDKVKAGSSIIGYWK